MRRILRAWCGLMLCLGTAKGEALPMSDYTHVTNGIALTAGFIPDASRVIVGEPLFLTFVLSNRAEQPFQFSHVRNEIFAVTATDADGKPAKSRYFGMDGNEPVSHVTVQPGKDYTARIFLNERCVFERPGDYTVTCRCNLRDYVNHFGDLGQPITTSFTLTVLPADP